MTKDRIQMSPNSSWTKDQLKCLARAYAAASPTDHHFWRSVGLAVPEKSADECRERWFSTYQYEKRSRRQEKSTNLPMQPTKSSALENAHILSAPWQDHDEDDIFQSTPFKETKRPSTAYTSGNEELSSDKSYHQELPFEFDAITASPANDLATARRCRSSFSFSPVLRNPSLVKVGYKGYIKNLSKGRTVHNRKLKSKYKTKCNGGRDDSVHASVGAGDICLNAHLSPGGTVRVDTPTESDLEDMILRPGEEFSDCEDGDDVEDGL
uniref:Myb-like domain-containing protein n=1 Tax=Leptocylindrus danicus TaxID=163516 RepID=A0A7S2NSH4_9STRA